LKPSQKSRSLRRIKLRLPGGKPTLHFSPKAGGKPTCSICGTELHGVVSSRTGSKASTFRVPTRPYAGVLCHSCLSSQIRQLARPVESDA